MDKRVNAATVKNGLNHLLQYVPVRFPATGWFFAAGIPSGSFTIGSKTRTCIFSCFDRVVRGGQVCFSSENAGCPGASCYFGFKMPSTSAGYFLAEKEHFKKDGQLADAFYREIEASAPESDYIVVQALADTNDALSVEVINLWVDGLGLAGLVTLANFDRPTNNNVVLPFASGCQSIWTIPYKEKYEMEPKCVVGCMDPAMRMFMPSDLISFSVPANRFVEMTTNISGSFLEENQWKRLIGKS